MAKLLRKRRKLEQGNPSRSAESSSSSDYEEEAFPSSDEEKSDSGRSVEEVDPSRLRAADRKSLEDMAFKAGSGSRDEEAYADLLK